jgi:hypothetical protein
MNLLGGTFIGCIRTQCCPTGHRPSEILLLSFLGFIFEIFVLVFLDFAFVWAFGVTFTRGVAVLAIY